MAPLTARKPARVRIPPRWVASNVTALGVVPVTPLTPYTAARAWFTDDFVLVNRSPNDPVPRIADVPKLRTSVSIAVTRSGLHIA